MGVETQAGRQPSGAAGLRPLLLLAARDDARNAPAGLLVGEPDAADHAPGGTEDGAALARPLRHPREQGPRLPEDGAADRALRARRHRQPARPDHPGGAEPGDAVLPGRAVQRQGRAERELRPRGDGALHHGRRQLLGDGRARVRARVHRVVLRRPHVQGRPRQARRRREDVPGPDRDLRRRGRAEDHLRAAGDGRVPGRQDLSLPGARRAVAAAAGEARRGAARPRLRGEAAADGDLLVEGLLQPGELRRPHQGAGGAPGRDDEAPRASTPCPACRTSTSRPSRWASTC